MPDHPTILARRSVTKEFPGAKALSDVSPTVREAKSDDSAAALKEIERIADSITKIRDGRSIGTIDVARDGADEPWMVRPDSRCRSSPASWAGCMHDRTARLFLREEDHERPAHSRSSLRRCGGSQSDPENRANPEVGRGGDG